MQSPSSAGFKRDAFVASLRHLQSVISNLPASTGEVADGIYNLPQHTNQFPYLETEKLCDTVSAAENHQYSFLDFLREGKDEVINFCEKRASAILYSKYTTDWYNATGTYIKTEGTQGYYTFTDGQVTPTSTSIVGNTIEDAGPYKHTAGTKTVKLSNTIEPLVMHGYNAKLNIHTVDAGEYFNEANEDLSEGFVILRDSFVHDPDVWYMQVALNVMDDYDGTLNGADFLSGPVEAVRDNWVEIVRTEAMTKEQAEALAASLQEVAYYTVSMKATGDINNATNIMDTFTAVDMSNYTLSEAGGTLQTVLARISGQDVVGGDTWYANAQKWAMNNGISDGTNPNGYITREQLAVMLTNYLKIMNVTVSTSQSSSSFKDQSSISSWAIDSVSAMKAAGVISGRDNGNFDSQGVATRAEAATMLMNFRKILAN